MSIPCHRQTPHEFFRGCFGKVWGWVSRKKYQKSPNPSRIPHQRQVGPYMLSVKNGYLFSASRNPHFCGLATVDIAIFSKSRYFKLDVRKKNSSNAFLSAENNSPTFCRAFRFWRNFGDQKNWLNAMISDDLEVQIRTKSACRWFRSSCRPTSQDPRGHIRVRNKRELDQLDRLNKLSGLASLGFYIN